ncbi:DNA pilot protein [Apis mellifera associated microvirus 21]|nr:DNA pilot protein [Apis mellifera associated microvirus 21]
MDLSGAITGGLSGVLSLIGTDMTNRANRAQAGDMMNFQERMSSTAHQREVADWEAAGFNKIAAMGGSGASSPTGAMAVMQNELEAGVASAREAFQLELAGKKVENETETTKSLKELNSALKEKALTEAKVLSKGIPEAEIKNDVYDVLRPGVKKIKEFFQQKSLPNPMYRK